MEEREKKFETEMKEKQKDIEKYVKSLSKEELQQQLINYYNVVAVLKGEHKYGN